jgi:hypothetical protein
LGNVLGVLGNVLGVSGNVLGVLGNVLGVLGVLGVLSVHSQTHLVALQKNSMHKEHFSST